MKKYAKIVNENTKQCIVAMGSDNAFYQKIGMQEYEVEKSEDGFWYLSGFLPPKQEKSYAEKRQESYPPLSEQLDMIYWDKINGTNLWQEKISQIKAQFPKS